MSFSEKKQCAKKKRKEIFHLFIKLFITNQSKMLTKLIRPLLENGLNYTKFVSGQSLSTSNVLFQQSSGSSAKPTDKSSKQQSKFYLFTNKKINFLLKMN
jgi:hypothetical protein